MRVYVLGRLRYIGFGLGIRQLSLLAEILRGKIERGRGEEMEGLPRQVERGMCKDGVGEERQAGLGLGEEQQEVEEHENGEDVDWKIGGRWAEYLGDWGKNKSRAGGGGGGVF